jgi:hypothetical protein
MLTDDRFEIEDGVLKAYRAGTETEVRIPEGVHTIADDVFKGMSWLLEITLPSTLKRVGNGAFKGCRQITRLVFPEGFLSVGEHAFHKCHKLGELIFPKTMTEVGACAFLYCDGLKKVVMEGPTHFGKAVFSHNMSLSEVALNADLDDSNFSDEVFEGCINLKRITLSGTTYELGNLIGTMDSHSDYPPLIKSIAKSVFHSMRIEDGVLTKFSINLKTITLPEGITAIGKGCFFDKRGIVSISLPSTLRAIRANAFLNCTGLESVSFQNDDVILDDKAFRGCCNLKTVILRGQSHDLKDESSDELVGRIRDQVLGDFYISGRILVRYMGSEEQVRIPGEVEIIGERCFFGNERVKTVLCPDGLKEIGEQAFAGCLTLQNVVLPAGLWRIGREAFAECRKLLKCNVPETAAYIGEYAFRRCLQLKTFDSMPAHAYIHPYAFYLAKNFDQPERPCKRADAGNGCGPEDGDDNGERIEPYAYAGKAGIKVLELKDINSIGKYAFASCPDLEEVIIDAPGCTLGKNAFSACPKLRKVRMNVKEVGEACFAYSRRLEEIRLSGVSVLPAQSFAGCYMLSRFEAKSVTRMGAGCFDECVSLDSFDFSGIKQIGERAFERCDALRSVKLGAVECGYHAFADCASLESVEIGEDTVLKSGAFTGSTQIRSIAWNGQSYEFSRFSDSLNRVDNPYPPRVREVIASVWSCFDIREGTELAGYSGDASRVTIPADTEEIGQDVFRDHARLEEIDIPESVRIFGSHAFSQTGWLAAQRAKSDMVIVNGVLTDGANCTGDVELPISVNRVAAWCFAGNTAITGLTIPSERIAIENLAFRNCLNLKRITDRDGSVYELERVTDLKDKDYPELVRRIFSECINCFKLDEDCSLIESTGNIKDLRFPEGIVSIGDAVYKDCLLLETIELAGDTASIGRCAFENSKWLRSVTGAGAVERIGAQAFSGCQSLEEIDLSDALTQLGARCFEHCVSLKEIHISDRLELIPARAFFRCKSIKKIVIPPSVKTIEDEAFAFCENLEEAYIPGDIALSDRVFAYCDRLTIHRT